MSGGRLILSAVVLASSLPRAGAWEVFFRPVNVQVSQVERDVPVQVFGLGTVEARVTSKVGFKVSGVLVELGADVGDRVAKGAVLAVSTTASNARRSPGPRRPSSRPRPIFNGPKQASKRRKPTTTMPRASAGASKDLFRPTPPRSRRQKRQRRRRTPHSRI